MIVLLHDNPNAQTVLNSQKGVLDAIGGTDLALAVRPVDRDSDTMLEDVKVFLEKQRPLAALLLPPISERDDLAELCESLGVRHMRVGSAILDAPNHCVASNDREMVFAACNLLLEKGHRRIAFVRGPQGFRSASEREIGFLDALRKGGLSLPDKFHVTGSYRFTSGVEAGTKLLSLMDRPTAIFASNDEMAAGVMRAAWLKGLNVPDELSVIGFDDSPTATHIWPQLTTVHWPIRKMMDMATRKVIASYLPPVTDGTDEDSLIVKSCLIERESVAPPKEP